MKNAITIILNGLMTGFFAVVVLIIGNILFLDVFNDNSSGDDSFFAFLATLFVTLFMVGLIHVFIFLPMIFIFKKFIVDNPIEKVYRTSIPVLFLLFILYLWIGGALIGGFGTSDEELIPIICIFGLCQYIIHAVSLYFLFNRVKEKDNDVILTTTV